MHDLTIQKGGRNSLKDLKGGEVKKLYTTRSITVVLISTRNENWFYFKDTFIIFMLSMK